MKSNWKEMLHIDETALERFTGKIMPFHAKTSGAMFYTVIFLVMSVFSKEKQSEYIKTGGFFSFKVIK